jgi:murein DD-endopeptidase MepM/ murein hydrolase activator NlpD
MVENEKQQFDAERAHEQPSLDPQTALDALQLQVAIEHGGITWVKPEIIWAPKEWTARFNGKEINILYTPLKGRPYFLLKQPIDVAKLIFSADNKAILDLKIPTATWEKRFTCTVIKDANEQAQLAIEDFKNEFPESIVLGGAFAWLQTKRWWDAVMITPDGSDELASFVVDRTKLVFPGDILTLPQVVSTNGAHLGVYKVKITRMRDKLVVTAEKLATEKIEKTQLTEKIAWAPDTWKLTRNGKEFRILVAEPGKRSYFVNAGRPVASKEINTFDARVVKVFTHAGETYQVIFSNTMWTISAELKKDDLDKKTLWAHNTWAWKFLTEDYANKTITISDEQITKQINIVPLHEQLLMTGKADAGSILFPAGYLEKKDATWYDIVVTMKGDVLQVEYKEVTAWVRGVKEDIVMHRWADAVNNIAAEEITYRTAHRENNALHIKNGKGEIIWQTQAIDPALVFSGVEGVKGGMEKLEKQRIAGRLRTVYATNEHGTLNVDVLPEHPSIKYVEIAEPKEGRTATVKKEDYTITLKHGTQGDVQLDLTKLPWSALSLEAGVAQGYITTPGKDAVVGGMYVVDACNTGGVVTIQCVPYHAETTSTSPKKGAHISTKEFLPQQWDIEPIYDETPPFRWATEIGQYQTTVIHGETKTKIDRLYVKYDDDTNNFSIYFIDTLLWQDGLNPDEQLLLLDLKLHHDKGKWFYTDALRGARWEVDVTVDAKRVLRASVVPPKNLHQLIERRKQQQGPKIDRSFPELGDAFKRIKTPEQLKQARDQLRKLIEGIGVIEDTPTDLIDTWGKEVKLGNETLTHIDKHVYPLGNVDVDLLKDMFVSLLPWWSTIDIMHDTWWPINDSLCKVDLSRLRPDVVYDVPGDDGTWKVKLIVDVKVVWNTTRKIVRVAVTPPQAWIDKQNPTHTDVVETPGKPFAWPLDNLQAPITHDFGELRDGGRRHQWIDIDVPNDPSKYPAAKASYDGKVKVVGFDERIITARDGTTKKVWYGHYVVLEHTIWNKKYITLYGHLSKVTVKEDQVIRRGEKVWVTGNSWWSSGAHLHFEVRKYDAKYNKKPGSDLNHWRPIDPLHVTNRSRATPTPSPRPAPRPAPQPAPNQSNVPPAEQFNETQGTIITLPTNEQIVITGTNNVDPKISSYTKQIESLNGGAQAFPNTRRLWRKDKTLYVYDSATQTKLLALDAAQFTMAIKSSSNRSGDTRFEWTGKQPFTIKGKQRKINFKLTPQKLVTVSMWPA